MAIQMVVPKKKQWIEWGILSLLAIALIFYIYKSFFKEEVVSQLEEKGIIVSREIVLYPSFSVKIQDVLKNSKFKNLEIFGQPIKEAGVIGNPNPFMPFTK